MTPGQRKTNLAKKISDAFDGEMMEDILPVLESIVAFAICNTYEERYRVEAFQQFTARTLREIAEVSIRMEHDEAHDHVH